MNPRKRQASDNTLSTRRRHKQPRLALKGYGGGTPSPSQEEGLLSRWNRFRMELITLSGDTLAAIFSKITLREPSDSREPESLDFSSLSTPQRISSPAFSLLSNESTDSHNTTPLRTVVPPRNPTTPQGNLTVQPTASQLNGTISTNDNKHLRDLPESLPVTYFARQTQQTLDDEIISEHLQSSNQLPPAGNVNRTFHLPTPSKGAPLKSKYHFRQPCTHKRPEDDDLPSTSRTPPHSLLKDSHFLSADCGITSWPNIKDDISEHINNLHLGSPSSLGSSQRFRFSTTSSNSHPLPDSHIPSFWKSSMRRATSGQHNRNRPHIHEKVHKAKVQQERLQLREDFLKKEYKFKRRTGAYTSDFPDFVGYTNYKKTLQDMNLDVVSFPRLLQGDLKFKFSTPSARHSTEVSDLSNAQPELVRRALDNANATLNSPKPPKPYIPNLDQLHISHRTRDDEIERRIRPPATPFPLCLPPADDASVSAILLQYGVISKFAREQVSDQDIARLLPGQWLNDEVINFYGAMILARSEGSKENPGFQRNGKTKKKAMFLDAHYFSSFFWSKLTKEGYENGRLAKWTKKIDIFNKDIILIPVNHQNAHWTAAAINFKKKRVESYDSMGMAKDKVFTHLRSYINAEHMNKKKKPFDFTDWNNWAPDSIPQQENGYDCGVFTCQFLEALSRGEDSFKFSQKNMPYLRRRMIWEIGNAKLRDDHY